MKLTEEQIEARRAILTEMENSLIKELKENGVELSETAVCRISSHHIEIGIAATGKYAEKGFTTEFASEINLYSKKEADELGFRKKDNEINFGSSGVFTPENYLPYWRTIHAASILKNWEKSCEIVNKYCAMYTNLVNQK